MTFEITDLTQLFFEESSDFIEQMESALLRLEQDGADLDALNQIFRCAHSIKGGSASLGYSEVTLFTHTLETLLDGMRSGQVGVDDDTVAVLFECADHVQGLLDAARSSSPYPDSAPLVTRLEIVIDGGNGVEENPTDEDAFRREIAVMLSEGGQADDTEETAFAILDRLMGANVPIGALTSDDEIEAAEVLMCAVDEPDKSTSSTPKPRKAPSIERGDEQVLRISAHKVDRLINLVGEMIIQQSMLVEAAGSNDPNRLNEAIEAISQSTRELQESVLAVRTLPVKQIFNRFPRIIRDVARRCGKQVKLETSGEDTELDKTIIEGLLDPLTHLIRNSVDHGVETPDVRIENGKPAFGTVWLRARHESGNIIIAISDDGKGLDRDRILRKAIEKGMVGADDVLSDEAVFALIYQPGFSTAESISDISGRGVGMDIVLESIRSLGGTIAVNSKLGVGTTFQLKLPITMAIVDGLTVRVGSELYVLPLANVIECMKPADADVHAIAGQGEVITLRSGVLSLTRLHAVFGVISEPAATATGVVIIIEHGSKRAALLVDEVVGQDQVVVKSLEMNYQNVEAVSGATILGDGKVALIVDIGGLPAFSNASVQYATAV